MTGVDIDLFNLIRAPNPTKVKTGSRPRAPHEVPLLTLTATRVIEMDDPSAATNSSGVPSTIERSPLDFAHEAGASDQGTVAPEMPSFEDVPATDAPRAGQAEETATTDPPAAPESRKRGRDETDVNAPPKSLRRDHADPRPSRSSHGGKVLMPYNWVWRLLFLCLKMFLQASATRIRCPSLTLRHAIQLMLPSKYSQGTATAGVPESENASSPIEVGSPESIYRPEWGVANGSLLDTLEACQDLVDHVAPPGYFFELRHMHNEEFLRQYNVNLAQQVAMGSQLRLRFEQEAKLLRKSVAQVARRDKKIQARELEIKNLEARLETEADMKKVSNEHLSQQVATLQEQVSREEKLKAAFEEFKRYEDNRVEQRCAELDARLDALSIDFDEELYPHMLTAIAAAGIAKGMSEGLRHGVEHGQAKLNVESIEAYDPEAEIKFVEALQALKDLKYSLMDQLEGLKDAHIDVIIAALYLESDTGDDASQYICDLRPSSSQLTIPVYPEVRDPRNPWAYREEMLLADAIAANVSCAEKKKKYRIVCRTHGVGSAHHARSDGVPVSVPTVVPQGLALLLVDAATQTEFDT
nr:hypothetical protein [Tanacetum cinerariifolium]